MKQTTINADVNRDVDILEDPDAHIHYVYRRIFYVLCSIININICCY